MLKIIGKVMQNVITTGEMLEQFGEVPLKFHLYFNNFFIFHGQSNVHNHIMLMIFVDSVHEMNPTNNLTLMDFAHIIEDTTHNNFKHINVKISNDYTNLYATMGN